MPFRKAVEKVSVIGIRCGRPFDEIVEHFQKLGGDVVLMDPMYVCGRDHIISAVMHAERAFGQGTNRSRTLLTETLLYAAGERQISRALEKMRPKDGVAEIAAAVFGAGGDLHLDDIDATADDTILECSPEKLKRMNITRTGNIPPGDLVLEMVATVDIQKQ